MISHYAVIEIFYVVFEILNTCLRTQIPEVKTAILVPSMDNSGKYFSIRYKNINNYSKYEFELTRIPRRTHYAKIKIGPI